MKSNKKGYAYKVMAYLLAIIIFLILIKIFVWPIIPRMVEPFLVWLGVEAGFEEGEDILDILRSKFKEGANINKLEQFFSVVGCDRFNPTDDAHSTALNKLRQDIDMNEVSPRNPEQFKILKEIYLKHEWDVNSGVTWNSVTKNINRINCQLVEDKNQNRNYYYYLQTEDGPYYIYQNYDDSLNDYIDKLSDHHDFKITWKYVSEVKDRALSVAIPEYSYMAVSGYDEPIIVKQSGYFKDIIETGTKYRLYYLKTKDNDYNIYLDTNSEIENYDARIDSTTFEKLDESGITLQQTENRLEQFFIRSKIVWWGVYEKDEKYCVKIGLIKEGEVVEEICYDNENQPVIYNESYYEEIEESQLYIPSEEEGSISNVFASAGYEAPNFNIRKEWYETNYPGETYNGTAEQNNGALEDLKNGIKKLYKNE